MAASSGDEHNKNMPAFNVNEGPPLPRNKHMILGEIAQHLKLTAWSQSPDNPMDLTAAEIADWKIHRKKWSDLAKVNFTNVHNGLDERARNDADIKIPLPAGWARTSRAIGELPDVFCRITDLDIYDPTSVITNMAGDAWDGEIMFRCLPPDDMVRTCPEGYHRDMYHIDNPE